MSDERESFLKRWSRVKHEAEQAAAQPPKQDEPPELPPLESLDFESDFSGFMHSKVNPDLKREALKKLFTSAHYRAMDGLDVYIGDYSNPEPLTPALIAGLAHARALLANDKKDDKAQETAQSEVDSQERTASAPPTAAADDQETG
ncbi:MAG: DUF3306 domain-containing protein [Burkholderiales bacterium]